MGGGKSSGASAAEPVKRKVGAKASGYEAQSLINRRGLQSTKMARNSLGGGMNLGGR